MILKKKDRKLIDKLQKTLDQNGIEFRLGSAGGGNQLRQPYIKKLFPKNTMLKFKNTEHMHFMECTLNYPELSKSKIDFILKILNTIEK